MADTSHVSNEDESLLIASKSFRRVIDAASTRGYRKGSISEHVFQRGFDDGYSDAFDVAFALGKYKSILHNAPKVVGLPIGIKTVLDKTRRGTCYICKLEQVDNINYPMEMSFSDMRDGQKKESDSVIQRLHEYFSPLM